MLELTRRECWAFFSQKGAIFLLVSNSLFSKATVLAGTLTGASKRALLDHVCSDVAPMMGLMTCAIMAIAVCFGRRMLGLGLAFYRLTFLNFDTFWC